MFKSNLLVTTAFVVVGSLSFSTAQSRPSAHPSLAQIAGHDNNHEFLCSYGSFKVSHYGSSSDSSYSSTWTHVAMPIMGHGKKVDRIIVANEGTVGVRRLQVKLRTSNASDLPGDPVAGRTVLARRNKCRHIEIPIHPTLLEKGKTYWIEETMPRTGYVYYDDTTRWAVDPKATRKAYVQKHRWYVNSHGVSHSFTSPWTNHSSGVYVRVR
ncbi:MAG TPA: hypothetical protein VHU23_13140 [Rhizomicrobium sp.]|jgi:hypothetical protein|nr:hypothetical protein [Rhizomicrobium sp.]